jgi:hypothetical protein
VIRRVVVVVVTVVAFYAVIVTVRIQQHGALWFVHIGHEFLTTSNTSSVIRPSLGWQSPVGYDGQYYFALAADPAHAHDYMPSSGGYVYSRIGYPMVARALSAGSIRALPYVMLIVNLVAVVGGTLAVALWLRRRRAPVWPAVLFGLYPGMIFAVLRDLTEPLAFGLVALAVLIYEPARPRRLAGSAIVLAFAALTRETVVPFTVAAAAALVVGDVRRTGTWRSFGSWRRGVSFAAGGLAPLLLWRLLVAGYLHEPTQETGGSGWAVPFHGIVSYWHWDSQHRLIVLTVVLPALAAGIGALDLVRRRVATVCAALLLANVLLYVVFLPGSVYVDYGGAGRAAVGVVLAASYCVPAWWHSATSRGATERGVRRALLYGAGFSWSLLWYLLVAWHYGLPGIDLITT